MFILIFFLFSKPLPFPFFLLFTELWHYFCINNTLRAPASPSPVSSTLYRSPPTSEDDSCSGYRSLSRLSKDLQSILDISGELFISKNLYASTPGSISSSSSLCVTACPSTTTSVTLSYPCRYSVSKWSLLSSSLAKAAMKVLYFSGSSFYEN